jgi:HSP20 family protein
MSEKKEKATRPERAPVPWRPFADLEPSFFGDWPFGGRLPRVWEEMRGGREGGFLPALDVHENEESYVLTVELAGVPKDDVHVELHEGTLTVRGEKKSEREEKKDQRRYVERSYGSFARSLRLPSDADADRLVAKFKDGVLEVTIPKTEETKPRTIAIK